MKALYTTSPGDYDLVERPVPVLESGEALVKVVKAALCHTDVRIRAGVAEHVRYPVIPGHEFSGVVAHCASDVKHLKAGDRVAVHSILDCGVCAASRLGDTNGCEHLDELGATRDGGFAEYCAIPANHLYLIPDSMSLEVAALVEPLANAVCAVRHVNVKLGEKVVVIGPGPIGLLVTQAARLAHPSVLALVGTRDERLKYGSACGATHTVNINKAGAVEQIKAILNHTGADAIIDCSGTRAGMELAMDLIGWRGRIALEGTTDEPITFRPFSVLTCHAATLMGIAGWVTADFCRALELLSAGLVNAQSLITHRFSLDEWQSAFDMITTRKSEAIKVEFTFE